MAARMHLFLQHCYTSFDRNAVLAKLLFRMLHFFLPFPHNNSTILSSPFSVIRLAHGLPLARLALLSYLVIRTFTFNTQMAIQYNCYVLLIKILFDQVISFLKCMNKWLVKEMVGEGLIVALHCVILIEENTHSFSTTKLSHLYNWKIINDFLL